jgi:hypothetical protein
MSGTNHIRSCHLSNNNKFHQRTGDVGMKRSVTGLLLRPDTFFAELINGRESLKLPAIILLVSGIISAATAYVVSGPSAKMMAGLMPGTEIIIMLSAIPIALIGVYLMWVIWTGFFYGFSYLFKGNGTFKRSLEVIGYGLLPQIAGSLITLVISVLYIPKVIAPHLTTSAAENPQMILDAVNALKNNPAMIEYNQIVSIVSVVFIVWSANYWIFGLKYARNISLRDAAICVAIPVVGIVLIIMYTLTVI